MKYLWTIIMLILTFSIVILSFFGITQDSVHFPLFLVIIGEICMCSGSYLMWKKESKIQSDAEVSRS